MKGDRWNAQLAVEFVLWIDTSEFRQLLFNSSGEEDLENIVSNTE